MLWLGGLQAWLCDQPTSKRGQKFPTIAKIPMNCKSNSQNANAKPNLLSTNETHLDKAQNSAKMSKLAGIFKQSSLSFHSTGTNHRATQITRVIWHPNISCICLACWGFDSFCIAHTESQIPFLKIAGC